MKTKAEKRESKKNRRINKMRKDYFNKENEQFKRKRNDKANLQDF